MPFVPRNLIKEEIQVLHDRVVVYQNLKTVVLKTKVYTATRPARRFTKGALTAVERSLTRAFNRVNRISKCWS